MIIYEKKKIEMCPEAAASSENLSDKFVLWVY